MRNLVQYPITSDEVKDTMTKTMFEYHQKSPIVPGSTDGYILNAINELIQNDEEVIAKLLEKLKIK